jgi:hypothetical protein
VTPAGTRRKMFRKESDVPRSFAQRRNVQRKHIHSIPKIASETPFVHHFLEVAVRGCNNANIRCDNSLTSHSLQRSILQHSKQSHLCRKWKFANLIEK